MTNQELYQAIQELRKSHETTNRSLEQYLSALLGLSCSYHDQETIAPAKFLAMISEAFVAPAVPFDPAWRNNLPTSPSNANSFEAWEAVLTQQIIDLREMDEAGMLANEYRYFGITAPRGGSWFNFDTLTYLECGMAGSFGGWDSDDTTQRIPVPGNVATMGPLGNIQIVRPEDIPNPVVEMPALSWAQCIDFVECGQWYE